MKKDDDEIPTYWCKHCDAGPLVGREELVRHINRSHARLFRSWLSESTAGHMPFYGRIDYLHNRDNK
jgi:hypothetical protein